MIISNIKIKNFGVFKGLKEFNLKNLKGHSTQAKPSINLIIGPNSSGKTSFIEAIRWCLTGTISEGFTCERDDSEACSVELTLKHGEVVYKIKRSSKRVIYPNECIPDVITRFMFVDGNNLSSLVFMDKGSGAERNEELFDTLFQDPIKRKSHEDILNSCLPPNKHGAKGPKIKVNYNKRCIEALQDSFNMGQNDIIHYQISLYLGIHSILRKEREFPLFFENIFLAMDDLIRHSVSNVFSLCDAQIFFIALPQELPCSKILENPDNIFRLKQKN